MARLADDGALQLAAEELVDEGVRRFPAVDLEFALQFGVDVRRRVGLHRQVEVVHDGVPTPRDLLGAHAVQQVAEQLVCVLLLEAAELRTAFADLVEERGRRDRRRRLALGVARQSHGRAVHVF